ncbi:SsgA family sporulation/cell division regulator [Amycolatopsis sp. EV170708-02-1]|uniref:SsgA family sporulation/cell division regulator n=1 Tax=Amycolatopsis sp. EV170708-02-1 TaxID=2919322 RepID=UPI001F0BEFEE|nr:SsgA family sporulation/cell division regulator [Amycolatopsis sp. EV170708-02-1]UMP07031.1 SsgA family sporulation/cell division regulator [Amycolatopsis sp. EV170708-02-1]
MVSDSLGFDGQTSSWSCELEITTTPQLLLRVMNRSEIPYVCWVKTPTALGMRTAMDTNVTRVRSQITLEVLREQERPEAVEAELRYDAESPFAIQFLFTVPSHGSVAWSVDREFLTAGMRRQEKAGVVHVSPVGGEITALEIEGSGPRLVCLMSSDRMSDFIESTNRLVPVGSEGDFLDLDAAFEAFIVDEYR